MIGATPSVAARTIAPARRRLQIALGLLWLLDGALQLQPFMFTKGLATQILMPTTAGQPAPLAAAITSAAHLVEPHVALFNGFAALVEVLIGLALLWRPTVRIGLLVSFAWALGVWALGEGFGMVLTGDASPLTGAPGAALLYVLLGLLVWPTAVSSISLPGASNRRVARIAWGALWLGFAALWLEPANRSPAAVHDQIAAAPSGAHWLSALLSSAADATAGHGAAIAIGGAAVSAAIGLGVLAGRAPRLLLALSLLVALAYWVLGQGLGGILTGTATDPNSAPLLMLLAVAVHTLAPATRRAHAAHTVHRPVKQRRALEGFC